MNKAAIAFALGAAAAAGASAQTNVQLYGLVDAYLGYVKNSTPTSSGSAFSVDSGGMSTSHFGIRGSEDFGSGLKAIFAFDAFFRADTGQAGRFNGDALFARDAYGGLQGAFGRVQLGRNTTPYFLSTVLFNPFGDSYTFSPAVAHTYLNGYLLNDSGWNNSVLFGSPTVGNWTANLIWSAGLERSAEPNKDAGKAFGGNANYSKGPLGFTLAYQQVDFETLVSSPLTNQRATMLGATYDFKVARLFGQYQYLKNEAAAREAKDEMFQLGVSAPFGPGSVLASYAHGKTTDNDGATSDGKRTSYAIGYDYFVSKRTDIYGAYFESRLDVGGAESKNRVLGTGLRHRF